MNRPDPVQAERALRLLAHEDASGASEPATTAAARVYDKIHAQMAPLVGDAGVQLLFVRSAKLTQGELASLAAFSILEGSAKLRERLHARDPAVSTEAAAALFGTFFSLLTTLIGERLTNQVVHRAWPKFDEMAQGNARP